MNVSEDRWSWGLLGTLGGYWEHQEPKKGWRLLGTRRAFENDGVGGYWEHVEPSAMGHH